MEGRADVKVTDDAGRVTGCGRLDQSLTFLVSLFNNNVNIYEVHNNGSWYNFGVMIGVSATFSGIGRSGAAAGPHRRPAPRPEG